MIHQTISIEHAISVLNRALKADPEAMLALIKMRVPCNGKLADDRTIQVGLDFTVGPLGIINGMFGADAEQWGTIAATLETSFVCKNGHVHPKPEVVQYDCILCGICEEKMVKIEKLVEFYDMERR